MVERKSIVVAGTTVAPGERTTVDLLAGKLYTREPIYMPVHVVVGKKPGPVMFVSAAIHGDELNGIEIVRRMLASRALARLRGTLLAVPIVNVLGVMHQSRYLPDRRDLNRCFPGSRRGSLAARMAHLFMQEIVAHADYGIDLHTGAIHRSNLPQVRACLDEPQVQRLANAFGAPVALHSKRRDGSLREAARAQGIGMLLYEAGEALRFDEMAIRVGVRGIFNVMRELGMLPARKRKPVSPFTARSSSWVRASGSGIFRAIVPLGAKTEKGQELGFISDPFGQAEQAIKAPFKGLVIGRSNLPLVHEGEALYHIARLTKPAAAAARVEKLQELTETDPQLDGQPSIV